MHQCSIGRGMAASLRNKGCVKVLMNCSESGNICGRRLRVDGYLLVRPRGDAPVFTRRNSGADHGNRSLPCLRNSRCPGNSLCSEYFAPIMCIIQLKNMILKYFYWRRSCFDLQQHIAAGHGADFRARSAVFPFKVGFVDRRLRPGCWRRPGQGAKSFRRSSEVA